MTDDELRQVIAVAINNIAEGLNLIADSLVDLAEIMTEENDDDF